MAPTLKEVNASAATEGSDDRGEIAIASEEEEERSSPRPPSSSSRDDPPDEDANGNDVARGGVDCGENDDDAAVAVGRATTIELTKATVPPPMTAMTTTSTKKTMKIIVERENPNDVPPDEYAFLVPPHFDAKDPFHRDLSCLDLSMRCTICSEFYRAPVTLLPCLHSFCSLCVRNHFRTTYTGMKRKADCPQCHAAVRMPGSTDYERGIVPDKQLEQRVDVYERCRDRLRERLVRLDVLEKERASGMPTTQDDHDDGGAGVGRRPSSRGGRERGTARRPSPKRARKATARDVYYSHAGESGSDVDDDYDDDEGDGDYDDASNSKISHDRAAAERARPQPPQQQQPLKRKATVSYHAMNRKKLVDICRGEGLSTHGNEAELKQRHSDYITLYNSECDSEHPRSVKQLLSEIKSREMSIKREAEQSGPKQQRVLIKHLADSLEAYNGGSIGRLTTSNSAFDAKFNNKYAELIASVKKREGRSSPADAELLVPAVQNDSLERKSSRSVDDEKPAIREDGDGQTAFTSSRQQTSGVSDLGDMDNEAVSPSVSTDSDKTVETPRKIREVSHEETSSPSASKYKTTGKRASARKSTSSKKSDSHSAVAMAFATTSSSRISSLGPWICNACTFENLRNITRNSRCEMCDTVRPKESEPDHHRKARDVEIVNIDC